MTGGSRWEWSPVTGWTLVRWASCVLCGHGFDWKGIIPVVCPDCLRTAEVVR